MKLCMLPDSLSTLDHKSDMTHPLRQMQLEQFRGRHTGEQIKNVENVSANKELLSNFCKNHLRTCIVPL